MVSMCPCVESMLRVCMNVAASGVWDGSLLLIATQPDGLIFVFECVGMYPSGTALVVV